MADIIHETVIGAAPERVREALTTSDGLAAFWTDQVRAKPEVGSEAWFGFGPGAEAEFRFEVAEISDERVDWRCVGGPDEWVGTEVRWLLRPENGGTTVRFEHRGWRSADGALGQCSFVWGQVLARLGSYLDTGSPSPYFKVAA